ncbi:hypothetical protein ACIPYQ_40360 [Streptomyces sp. NPDC090045]|uniref:hypothetical protein n=1 Tax=Streptomyces sp. NPDC090045 TaxID=3365927 RepID=UPI0037F549EA
MDRILTAMSDAGLTASKSKVNPDVPLVEETQRVLWQGDVLLIKGANSLALEAVARELAAPCAV